MVALHKTNWQWLRVALLTGLLGGVGLCLGRSLLLSKMGSGIDVPTVTFPAEVPLANWQLVQSQEISERSLKSLKQVIDGGNSASLKAVAAFTEVPVAGGRRYQYRQGIHTLQIEMRHLVNTSGEVASFLTALNEFSTQQPPITIHKQPTVGSYGVFTFQNKTYLSSCISPNGNGSFTRQQFVTERLRSNLTPNHLWRWLLNQAEIPDRRCFWAYIWIAHPATAPATAQLEAVWSQWYLEWRSRLPQDYSNARLRTVQPG